MKKVTGQFPTEGTVRRRLAWYYINAGTWHAASDLRDEGGPFVWRIKFLPDGKFSVAASDCTLTNREDPFASLDAAKVFCETAELTFLAFTD